MRSGRSSAVSRRSAHLARTEDQVVLLDMFPESRFSFLSRSIWNRRSTVWMISSLLKRLCDKVDRTEFHCLHSPFDGSERADENERQPLIALLISSSSVIPSMTGILRSLITRDISARDERMSSAHGRSRLMILHIPSPQRVSSGPSAYSAHHQQSEFVHLIAPVLYRDREGGPLTPDGICLNCSPCS